jgi:hypothetical protein
VNEEHRTMTERQPGRGDSDDRKYPAAKPKQAGSEPIPDGDSDPSPDEEALFFTDSGPRLFGEGSYSEGGSNEEGNFAEREASPHGGLGSFDDAGGFGAAQLLGEHEAEAARRRRRASDETKGPDETVEDS